MKNRIIVFSTYFAQGLPYTLIATISSVLFRDMGMGLSGIGLLSLLSFPWVIKFFWSPFVDTVKTKRWWLLIMEFLLLIVFGGVVISLSWPTLFVPIIILFGFGAIVSATHDIAVDGFYMTALDEAEQKKYIGFRVLAYRLAMMFGTGVIVSIGTMYSWRCGYGVALLIFLLLYLLHKKMLPHVVSAQKNKDQRKFKDAFITFFKREHIVSALMFILFLRAGEYMLGLMRGPFMVDLGIKEHIGWITAGTGIPASIAGAFAGGYLISRFSWKKVAIPIILFQNGTNVLYAAAAFFYKSVVLVNVSNPGSMKPGISAISIVALISTIEHFSAGFGTALLMTFLMKLCHKAFESSHYAIGSGFMALSGMLFNSGGGFVAEYTGYGWFFIISFAMAMPALLFIPREEIFE